MISGCVCGYRGECSLKKLGEKRPLLGGFFYGEGCFDGPNWYVYAANNPLRFNDPDGKELQDLIDRHGIIKFNKEIQKHFINLYNMTQGKDYAPCNKLFDDYFSELGYDVIQKEIKKMPGKTVIEKTLNYEKETGKIETFTSGFKAQQYANQGKNVGVVGQYEYYDTKEGKMKETSHYGIVTPSNATFDDKGNALKYLMSDIELKLAVKQDPNNATGKGPLITNMGAGNGMVAFSWAFNTSKKPDAKYDIDESGMTYGTIFILFPDLDNITQNTDENRIDIQIENDNIDFHDRQMKINYTFINGVYIAIPVYEDN